VLRREPEYLTAAGPVTVMRTLYMDHADEGSRAIVPLELRVGIVEGFWTPLAAQQRAWVYHTAEHLNAALADAYGDGTIETRRRFEGLRFNLREDVDGVERVIRSLAYLKKKFPHRKQIAKELAFFRKNRDRMRYKALLDQGLPIGSGWSRQRARHWPLSD
jgi:hypothetical protein